MPELPEVETIRREITPQITGSRISGITGSQPTLNPELTIHRAWVEDRRIEGTSRHGKYLFVCLDSGPSLVFHFGMTGDLVLMSENDPVPPYCRAAVSFIDGSRLAFTDPRRFGRLGWIPDRDDFIRAKRLGPDALVIPAEKLMPLVQRSRQRMKFFLLDQHKLAGIGNIYADEILFQAGIHPLREAASLMPDQAARIQPLMQDILRIAISLEADFDRYPGTWLIPHRAPGELCPVCSGEVNRVMIAGRYAYFCPSCQE
jgi:formamidopyrimidine-DNA glycosylase